MWPSVAWNETSALQQQYKTFQNRKKGLWHLSRATEPAKIAICNPSHCKLTRMSEFITPLAEVVNITSLQITFQSALQFLLIFYNSTTRAMAMPQRHRLQIESWTVQHPSCLQCSAGPPGILMELHSDAASCTDMLISKVSSVSATWADKDHQSHVSLLAEVFWQAQKQI